MPEVTVDTSRQSRAVVKYLRISPRKVRLVTQAISRKPVPIALDILTSLKKKAARLVEKGLKSAVSNAKLKGLQESRLLVSQIKADGGPTIKRFMSRSMGRADQILKRTTHLSILLEEGKKVFNLSPAMEKGEEKAREKGKVKKVKKAAAGEREIKKVAAKA